MHKQNFFELFFFPFSIIILEYSCGGVLTNSSGEIISPNYPNNYPDDITCTWKISPGKTHVNLTIEDFMVSVQSALSLSLSAERTPL